ncbi:MAG: hypothetical protein J0I69_06850 [Altererythrobacter sp.]|nr:hypothetical protein [Altererythrobacter sp.]OJU59626.1 MAG: hypothetical protein BGO08_01270 [Altererythrobacter sp. 66-12]
MDDYRSTRKPGSIRSPSGLRMLVGAVLAAFLLGAAGAWYLTGGSASLRGLFSVQNEAPPPSTQQRLAAQVPAVDAEALSTADDRTARMLEQQSGLDQRIAEMEQRLARLDVQAQEAEGNAARAEGLLIAFASRRAIERGAPLGYLEEQLQLRFGAARPDAVRTVIEASRHPVTLDQLLAQLDGLRPQLMRSPSDEGAIGWLWRELGSLFVVRRENAPSPAPARRIERARLFLESGRAGAAAAEIRNLPNSAAAADWIADAERYATTQRALELLELTAILEPRDLRDASGEKVEQPSPVGAR